MELEPLLQPISEDQPTGMDLRADGSATSNYAKLKDARNQARTAERNSVFDENSDSSREQWVLIKDLAPRVLQGESKDLEVACWYTEALVRLRGFDGLAFGFSLIKGLVDNFWDQLYPEPDEDGVETKVAALTGLNGEGAEGVLIPPIRNNLLTEGQGDMDFALWQYQRAVEIQHIGNEEVRAKQLSANGYGMSDIERAVTETSDDFLIRLRANLKSALTTYQTLTTHLDELCGIHSPPSRKILTVLEDCQSAVNYLYRERIAAMTAIEESEAEQAETADEISVSGDGTTGTGRTVSAGIGPITSREDAFRQIQTIADFFRRTEPHSPVPYKLEQAIHWGKMPLSSLIKELIPDQGALEQFRIMTGVKEEQ